MRVTVRDLRQGKAPLPSGRAVPRDTPAVTRPERLNETTRELILIGSTVDQAIDRVEKFLDDALLADERRLRIVHGVGTGRLRDALTKFFREHPLVASVQQAAENEGGAGATIVELKD